MTNKLYLHSPELSADVEVLSCREVESGRYAVSLDVTPFYPQGGGQPSDVGTLGEAQVLHAAAENDDVIHYVNQPIPLGKTRAEVSATARKLHSSLHSAGHLLAHVLVSQGWQAIKAHHWPGEARVVFKASDDIPAAELDTAMAQQLCEAAIAQDLPCKIVINDNKYREVTFGDFAPYGCGGTHVNSTGELAGLRVLSMKFKKGQLTFNYDVESAKNSMK